MKKNKLIPFIFLVIVSVLGGLVYFAKNDVNVDLGSAGSFFKLGNPTNKKEVIVDGDLPEHTIKNIARDGRKLKKDIKAFGVETKQRTKEMKQLQVALEKSNENTAKLQTLVATQTAMINDLRNRATPEKFDVDGFKSNFLSEIKEEFKSIIPDMSEYKINAPAGSEGKSKEDANKSTRVRSINVPINDKGEVSKEYIQRLNSTGKDGPRRPAGAITANVKEKEIIDPRYTIFQNSILYDAVTVTHLIGRIPKNNGNITNPAPFKIIIGNENLAANGFRIPGLDGMIMSGIVYGDATLKCVRTKIQSATYIFEDGRGITFPKNAGGKKEPIGWLSDPYGNPCIKGRYHTNARAQLTRSFIAGMALGAAKAFAGAETTSSVFNDASGSGSSTTVTGDKGKYALGQAASGGLKRVTDYMEKQTYDIWDAVIVSSGQQVSVHLDQTLELDQSSLQRRVVYDNAENVSGLTD